MTLPTPYYQDDAVTLYHGDCREILPLIQADAIVTDPPYGIGFRGNEWDAEIPDWLRLARNSAPIVAFTTAPLTLWDYPRPDWVLCWARPASNSRSKLAGFSWWSPILVYGTPIFAIDFISLHAIQHSAPSDNHHPTPKPDSLMLWLVKGCSSESDTILDPFAGSGTTLRAAKDLGRKAIGIEIEEKYCEIAARRCAQEVLL
jgi:DNA modification methylase